VFRSLKAKFILTSVVALSLFIGSSLWFNLRVQRGEMERATREHVTLLGESIQRGLVTAMLEGKGREVQKVVEAMGQHSEVRTVRILDLRGWVLHSSRPEEIGSVVSGTASRNVDTKKPSLFVEEAGYERIYGTVIPIENQPPCRRCHGSDHAIRGLLNVEVSATEREARIASHQRFMTILGGVLILLVVGAVVFAHSRFVEEPIQALVRAMGRVEEGNLNARVPVKTADELGYLARRFNSMVQEIEKARKDLEEYHHQRMERADRLATIGEMASGIAHEIKNPLAGISGAIQVLAQEVAKDASRREVVEEIQAQVRRIDRAVKDLLSYARPSLPCLAPHSLNVLLDRTLLLIRQMIEQQHITLEKQYAPDLPVTLVDEAQIQQVFLNLCLNAVQAMPEGGTLTLATALKTYDEVLLRAVAVQGPRSEVQGQSSDFGLRLPAARLPVGQGQAGTLDTCDFFEITVSDTGVGIPLEDLDRIFQPFFTTRHTGTGLGLSISKRFVDQHGGMIAAHSEPGGGATFTVFLPYKPVES
jgi:signal transduction histidine kinase